MSAIAYCVQEPVSSYHVDRATGEILDFPLSASYINKIRSEEKKSLQNKEEQDRRVHPFGLESPDIRTYWIRTDNDFLALMIDLKLPVNTRAVLDAMMMKALYGNKVMCGRKKLSEITNIAPNHVSDAIKALIDHDLVTRVGRDEYLLNPLYCFKGNGGNRAKAIAIYYETKKQSQLKQLANQP